MKGRGFSRRAATIFFILSFRAVRSRASGEDERGICSYAVLSQARHDSYQGMASASTMCHAVPIAAATRPCTHGSSHRPRMLIVTAQHDALQNRCHYERGVDRPGGPRLNLIHRWVPHVSRVSKRGIRCPEIVTNIRATVEERPFRAAFASHQTRPLGPVVALPPGLKLLIDRSLSLA